MPTIAQLIGWGVTAVGWVMSLLGKKPATTTPPPDPFTEGQDAGKAEQTAVDAQVALKVETAVAQGEAQAPADKAEIVAEMREGTF